ncbi:hypothetical protein ACFXOY_18290 [Streptomyces niveus]|uniref:hypothetical protein n=1 Tax=Streptomyces niveus TaxID=193462 RepID=UPI0036CDFB9A
MARESYFVDWSDPPFPKILNIKFAAGYAEPRTLTEAKREIVDHFRNDISHAREQIRLVRELRAEDLVVS